MIFFLSGRLLSKKPTHVVINVNGVGYGVSVSLQTFYSLGDIGGEAQLNVYTHVREDVLQLYGFSSENEKYVFEKLISVSKIGPKLALTILSGIPYPELVKAIGMGDVAKLSSIPGVGKKTAERLILELKDKFPEITDIKASVEKSPQSDGHDDAVQALLSLGYKKVEAEKAVKDVLAKKDDMDLESILRNSLKNLS